MGKESLLIPCQGYCMVLCLIVARGMEEKGSVEYNAQDQLVLTDSVKVKGRGMTLTYSFVGLDQLSTSINALSSGIYTMKAKRVLRLFICPRRHDNWHVSPWRKVGWCPVCVQVWHTMCLLCALKNWQYDPTMPEHASLSAFWPPLDPDKQRNPWVSLFSELLWGDYLQLPSPPNAFSQLWAGL